MPPKNFKNLSLPDATYEGIQRARAELQQRGVAAIPAELLHPETCPSCHGSVEHVTVGIQHIKCHGCGYAQQTVSVSASAGFVPFATGALVGAAVAALFMYMSRDDASATRATAIRAVSPATPAKRLAPAKSKKRTAKRASRRDTPSRAV